MERMKEGDLTWVDLAAKDLDGQTRFYEGVFGWTHEDVPTDQGPIYRQFKNDGAIVAGASQMNPQMEAAGMPSVWNTYIAADSVDDVASRAEKLGGKVVMPAMDVMDQGRMVGVQDPTGGTVFFWQAGTHRGAQAFNEPGALGWGELDTREPEKAASFFHDLLGWEAEQSRSEQPYWMVQTHGEQEVGIMPMPQGIPAEVPSYWLDYFVVQNPAETVERARQLGADIKVPPTEAPGLTFAVMADPAGAIFAVMNQPQMPAQS